MKKYYFLILILLIFCEKAPLKQCIYCSKIYKNNKIINLNKISIDFKSNPPQKFICNQCAYLDTTINLSIEYNCKVCKKSNFKDEFIEIKKIDLFNKNYISQEKYICPNCTYIHSAGLINDDYRIMYNGEWGGLHLWNDPKTRAHITGRIDKPNTLVKVLDFRDEHFFVEYKNQKGWISKGVLTGKY